MPQQILTTLENNFTGGLKTENNPLSFPENACTDTDNCTFSITGNVSVRPGMDLEENFLYTNIDRTIRAMTSYKWNNAGGDGNTQILVQQVGNNLHFYVASNATAALPLSRQKLVSIIDLNVYVPVGNVQDTAFTECQFADGNGYLFVYHPNVEPLYCTLATGAVTATVIPIQIRDFSGIPEPGVPVSQRPGSLTAEHAYNLNNQGWTQGSAWTSTDSTSPPFTSAPFTPALTTGSHAFTIAAGLPIVNGDNVQVYAPDISNFGYIDLSVPIMTGSVTSYAGTTLTLSVYSVQPYIPVNTPTSINGPFVLNPINIGYINTWFTAIGNYPSNADVWWKFKDASDVFAPATTVQNVSLNSGQAPQGHYILNAFNQQRALLSGVSGLTTLSTPIRAKAGAWFQGRVWYAGVDASQIATGDQPHYSWSENIYFSQVIQNTSQFGFCYQVNDPTSQDFFDLLPTDGGTIKIQGCGSINKLFPVMNGLIVFASQGIWFITGSQGIGFSATDYTITKISNIQSISGSSFVNVLGWPVFWNEEGIYSVTPSQQGGGLTVENMCQGTILSFYAQIPAISKKYAKGDYNPLEFVITWLFRSENETDITSRYNYNRALNFNTSNKAFYPFTFVGSTSVHDVKYISSPGGSTAPDPTFKFFSSASDNLSTTFAELRDVTHWVDFYSVGLVGVSYDSFFVTGYKLHGQALTKFQPMYINMFSQADVPTAYKIQAIWDFANNPNSGKYSGIQLITNALSRFGIVYRRHKIRGRGIALQFKVSSVDGLPFDILGWSTVEAKNTGV